MSITTVGFTPSTSAPFTFPAILDGVQYNIVITYNLYGERYYVNVYTTQGKLILCAPVVGSPTGYDIDILSGYFKSTLVFRTLTNNFEISTAPVVYNPVLGTIPQPIGNILDFDFVLDQSELA